MAVLLGFIGAGYLINSSYSEWNASPVATTVSTHAIDKLDFPIVTVCPPKGSNTALNYDLIKADNNSLSKKQRKELKHFINKILIEPSHLDNLRKVVAISNPSNLKQVFNGSQSFPKEYLGSTGFEVRMWSDNGTWHTPDFHGDFDKTYYKDSKHHHIALDFPENLRDNIGSGVLVIHLEVDIRENEGWQEYVEYSAQRTKLYTEKKSWAYAEAHCQWEGGHLASIMSQEDQQEVKDVVNGQKYTWIGGNDMTKEGQWMWSDGSPWAYSNWEKGYKNRGKTDNCVQLFEDGLWGDGRCGYTNPFVCQSKPVILRGNSNLTIQLTRDQLTFPVFHIWYRYNFTSQQLLDSWTDQRMTGFKLTWFLSNAKVASVASVAGVNQHTQEAYIVSLGKLANHARVNHNISREDIIRKTVIGKAEALKSDKFDYTSNCSRGEVNIKSVGYILDIIDFRLSVVPNVSSVTNEDIETGIMIYSVIVYCSEPIALSQFLHSLLSTQSPRTIIQATVNSIQYFRFEEQANRIRISQFYQALDKMLHFQLGKILLATSSKEQLEDLMAQDLPWIFQYSKEVHQCLNNASCQGVEDLVQNLGKILYRLIIYFCLGSSEDDYDMSLTPPHIIGYNGTLNPYALIPFCAYQTNMTILGQNRPDLPFTACSQFQPTVLEGQRCYSLDLGLMQTPKTRVGDTHGLLIVLDQGKSGNYKPAKEPSLDPKKKILSLNEEPPTRSYRSVKIYMNTLARHERHGAGRYAMTALKRMTGTKSFLNLPDDTKHCQIEAFEKCNNRLFKKKVQRQCRCVPWALKSMFEHKVIKEWFINSWLFSGVTLLLPKCLFLLREPGRGQPRLQGVLQWTLCGCLQIQHQKPIIRF